jgi:hypothetical protein
MVKKASKNHYKRLSIACLIGVVKLKSINRTDSIANQILGLIGEQALHKTLRQEDFNGFLLL